MEYTMHSGPCQTCKKRHLGCHGTCKEYLEWKAYRDEVKQTIFDAKSKEYHSVKATKSMWNKIKKNK